MLNPHEAALESKCEKIARIITRNYGVSVRIEGLNAYYDFDTKTLILPNLADEHLKSLSGVLDGFLDHECAHAVFTDASFVPDDKKDPTLFTIWNTLEDSWIEKAQGKMYPGCKQNLKKLNVTLSGYIKADWDKLDILEKLLFYMSECWWGFSKPKQFFKDKDCGALLEALQPELQEGYFLDSTKGALELSQKILAKIKSMSKGKNKKHGKKENKDKNEASHNAKTKNQNKKQTKANGKTKKQAREQANEFERKRAKGELKRSLDAEKLVNRLLDEMLDIPDTSRFDDPEHYLIYSEEFDDERNFSLEERFEWSKRYQELKGHIQQYVGNMAATLELALTAETANRWVGGGRFGKRFDKRKLPGWFMGSDEDRLFQIRELGNYWDTAVSLLIDCSGSMGSASNRYNKAALARLAGIAFHEALIRGRVVHEILGFNTGGRDSKDLRQRAREAENRGENLDRYSRVYERDNRFVFVPFGSNDGRALCGITGGSANRDGEAVMWASKRLASRKEKRKVLIVISDGMPAGARYRFTERKYLQEAIQRVIGAGIEVYAIGVKSEHVKKFYPNWVTLDHAEDLPRVVLQQLGQSILERKGTENANLSKVVRPTSGASF